MTDTKAPSEMDSQQRIKQDTTTIRGTVDPVTILTPGDQPVAHVSLIPNGTLHDISYVGAWVEDTSRTGIPQTIDIDSTTRKPSIDGSTSGSSGAVIDAHFMNHRHDLSDLEAHIIEHGNLHHKLAALQLG